MKVLQAFMAVLLGLGFVAGVRAEGPPERPEEKAVLDLQFQVVKGKAERDALTDLAELLDKHAAVEQPEAGKVALDPGNLAKVWKAIGDELGKTHQPRIGALHDLGRVLEARKLEESPPQAEEAWRAAALASVRFQEQRARSEGQLGMRLGAADRPPFWDRSTLFVMWWGVLAVCAGLLIVLHESRGRVRWTLRSLGSQPALVLLAVTGVSLGFGCGSRLGSNGMAPATAEERAFLEAERGRLQGEWDELEPKLKDARESIQEKLDKALDRLFPRAKATTGAVQAASEIRKKEADAQAKLRDLFVQARTTKALADDGIPRLDKLESDSKDLKAFEDKEWYRAMFQGAARTVLCLGFAGAAFLPLRRARRRHLRQIQEASEQCPRCLETGNLELVPTEVQDAADNELNVVYCPDCQYSFREGYRFVPRICFPTVGVRGSGKTRWLLTAYEMIRNSNIPVPATLTNVPSLDTNQEEIFETEIKNALELHGDTLGTDLALPAPLTYYLKDRDPLGREELLLNMFDFSGEVMTRELAMDSIRRRALLFDGFILFLDPTQVRNDPKLLNINDQIKALLKFKEEMRAVRGMALGKPIDIPIAVCISKIDMLVTKNPMEGLSRDLIDKLRATMFDPVNLHTIQKRSALCAQALPMIFPGWQIERDLRENFGGRFMFFPLTPVGLEEGELGVEDLKQRNFAPFGILEPILWLFHMHGYCIFG